MKAADLPTIPPPPGWVTSDSSLRTGLDLLGLRAAAMEIGNRALDGVTTISPTIRYYALRSWIIHRYGEARLPDSHSSFLGFAARVEAAMVLGNLLIDPKMTGLVGADKARDFLNSRRDPLPLERLVKQLATAAYGGPSDQLGLTFSRREVPGLTKERGEPLALAVEEVLGSTSFGQRLRLNPELGKLSREQLEELGESYSMQQPSGKEQALLLAALMPSEPRTSEVPRIASYALLLWLAARDKGKLDEWTLFKEAIVPSRKLPDALAPILQQWLFYLVRDTLAVCHEQAFGAIHDAVRQSATEAGWAPVDQVLGRLVGDSDALVQCLKDYGLTDARKSDLDGPLAPFEDKVKRSCGAVRKWMDSVHLWSGTLNEIRVEYFAEEGNASATVALLVAWLLAEFRVGASPDPASPAVEALSYQGANRFGLQDVVLPTLAEFRTANRTVRQCLTELLYRTADQHLRVAWNRAAFEPSRDVATIASDANSWSVVQEFQAGRAASRLSQALGYLAQLDLIREGKGLTQLGQKSLEHSLGTLKDHKGDR